MLYLIVILPQNHQNVNHYFYFLHQFLQRCILVFLSGVYFGTVRRQSYASLHRTYAPTLQYFLLLLPEVHTCPALFSCIPSSSTTSHPAISKRVTYSQNGIAM